MTRFNKPKRQRLKWKSEEDEMLLDLFNKYGAKWKLISSKMDKHFKHKSPDKYRERYYNHLDPKVKKSSWSTYELNQLNLLYSNGIKFSEIAKILNRSVRDVSNKLHNENNKVNPNSNGETPTPNNVQEINSINIQSNQDNIEYLISQGVEHFPNNFHMKDKNDEISVNTFPPTPTIYYHDSEEHEDKRLHISMN